MSFGNTRKFTFRVDMDLKIIVDVIAEDLDTAEEIISNMYEYELLNHQIIDVPTIDYRLWEEDAA